MALGMDKLSFQLQLQDTSKNGLLGNAKGCGISFDYVSKSLCRGHPVSS